MWASLSFMALTQPLVLSASSPAKSDSQSAEKFVRALYQRYTADADFSSLGKDEARIYSASVMRLIKADQRRTPAGDQAALDADPLCQCQDEDGLKLVDMKSVAVSASKVQVVVTIKLQKQSPALTKLRLHLIHEPNGWRVDDVLPITGLSMRQILMPTAK